jgi:hypothetical protein
MDVPGVLRQQAAFPALVQIFVEFVCELLAYGYVDSVAGLGRFIDDRRLSLLPEMPDCLQQALR